MKIDKELLTVNFRPGRPMAIDMVTIHVTEGTHEGTAEHFASDATDASAHYEVLKTGRIVQYVEEKDQAFHNGRVHEPTAPLVLERPGVNPNAYSIGIEHEGSGKEAMTPPQLAASLELVRDICTRYHIPMDRRHIVGHREVYSLKTCPGKINVDALVLALHTNSPVQGRGPVPKIVWSDYYSDYLIVTRYVSDTNWSFVTYKEIQTMTPIRGETPLSLMPKA